MAFVQSAGIKMSGSHPNQAWKRVSEWVWK